MHFRCISDYQGTLVCAQALWYQHAASATVMEAIAIRDAVRLAADRGFTQVIIESDSKEVVTLCAGDDHTRSELMPIYQEVREYRRALPSLSIVFVGREANHAAHLCPKQARADRRRCLWINYKPSFLMDTLMTDCNPTS